MLAAFVSGLFGIILLRAEKYKKKEEATLINASLYIIQVNLYVFMYVYSMCVTHTYIVDTV